MSKRLRLTPPCTGADRLRVAALDGGVGAAVGTSRIAERSPVESVTERTDVTADLAGCESGTRASDRISSESAGWFAIDLAAVVETFERSISPSN